MTINTQAENIINFFMDFIEEHCSKDAIRKIKSEEMQDQLMKLAQQEMTDEDTKELRMNQRIDALEENYQDLDKMIEEKVSVLFTKFHEEKSEYFTTENEKIKTYQTERAQIDCTMMEHMYMLEDKIQTVEKELQEKTNEVVEFIQEFKHEQIKNQEAIMAIQKDREEDHELTMSSSLCQVGISSCTGIEWVDKLPLLRVDKNNNVYTNSGIKIGTTTNVYGKYYDPNEFRKTMEKLGYPGSKEGMKQAAKYIEYLPLYSKHLNQDGTTRSVCEKNQLAPMFEINLLDEFKDFNPDRSYYHNSKLYRSPQKEFPMETI